MSAFTWQADWDWVHTPEEINELIQDEKHPTLTSAEQIISVSWDISRNAYLVCWKVRKWLNGTEEADGAG